VTQIVRLGLFFGLLFPTRIRPVGTIMQISLKRALCGVAQTQLSYTTSSFE
jgi:hypothetical protein